MDETRLLSQVDQYVGVVIAFVGTFVAAPDGARLLWNTPSDWLRRQASQTRERLVRLVRRPGPVVRVADVGGRVVAGGVVTVAVVRGWSPTASVDERIEVLHRQFTEVEGRLHEIAQLLRDETSKREAALAELERVLRVQVADVRQMLDQRDRESAAIDARGLPVVGLGVMLSGIPGPLALIPWHLGWIVPASSVAVAAGHAVWRHRHRPG